MYRHFPTGKPELRPNAGAVLILLCHKNRPKINLGLFGGQRWIRTIVDRVGRFTVCSLWPLGNLPINNIGAGDRNRTNNLLITNQLLCLLSYTSAPQYAVVPRGGLEPPTRGFSVPCYYQLSYRGKKMAIRKGLEPSTSSVTG